MSNDTLIQIDGREFEFEPSETILGVAERNGIEIPTLCYLKNTVPTGACRICLVEVKGARSLLPSCSTPAVKDMVVTTKSPKVLRVRRTIIEFLLISGNHNCAIRGTMPGQWTMLQKQTNSYNQDNTICDAYGKCKLQRYAYLYQVNSTRIQGFTPQYAMEAENGLIVRNFSRCIQCGRCVQACKELMVNHAISAGYRGMESKMTALGDQPLSHSDCGFCGECMRVCPVGALVEKKNRDKIYLWQTEQTHTTCHYCGVGCQMVVHTRENQIVKVSSSEEKAPNHGQLCFRGRFAYDFVNSEKRLQKPLIKKNGKFEEASWDQALSVIAKKIKGIKEKYGPGSIAGLASPKHTNEDLYAMQKFFRAVVGTNTITQTEHIAVPGRFMTTSFEEVEQASCFIILGSDITETNPTAAAFVKRAVIKGAKLMVIDQDTTKISKFATHHLKAKKGTEDILINSLLAESAQGSKPVFKADSAAEVTGVDKEDIIAASKILGQSKSTVLIYSPEGIHSACILENFKKIPHCTVHCISGNNNTQGACDMGMLPEYLPGYVRLDDPDGLKLFEETWDCNLDTEPGPVLSDLIEGMAGNIKLLYCVGDSIALAKCDTKNMEFTVVHDLFQTEHTRNADVILPAAAWCEYDGTYTNSEGRVNRVRKAVHSPGEAKPHWWIFNSLAQKLGKNWDFVSEKLIWNNEIIKIIPQLSTLTYEAIEEQGKIWHPFRGENDPSIIVPGWASAPYNHKVLIEHCQGLEDALRHVDYDEVVRKFDEFLKEEGIEAKKEMIDAILQKYRMIPGGLIPVLQQIQEIIGFLPAIVQNYIARGLNLPSSDVFGVVTFYAFFTMVPRGKHIVKVCLGTACYVLGSKNILKNLQKGLNLEVGETTKDRLYSLETVRCLGACGLAPVMVIGDDTHGQVNPPEAMSILETYQ